jgi:hypothetical protein
LGDADNSTASAGGTTAPPPMHYCNPDIVLPSLSPGGC